MPNTSDAFKTYYKFNKINENNPIIFIHGVGLSHRMWDDQIIYFRKFNTIVYDLIGHNKTPLNQNRISMKNFNKQLLKLVDELNINKFHLVGFSLGSLIARDFASVHDDRLKSLTISGTVYKRSKDEKTQILNRYETMKLKKDNTKKELYTDGLQKSLLKKTHLFIKKSTQC